MKRKESSRQPFTLLLSVNIKKRRILREIRERKIEYDSRAGATDTLPEASARAQLVAVFACIGATAHVYVLSV